MLPIVKTAVDAIMSEDDPRVACHDVELVWLRYGFPDCWKAYCPVCGRLFASWAPMRVRLCTPEHSPHWIGQAGRSASRVMAIIGRDIEKRAATVIVDAQHEITRTETASFIFKPARRRKPKIYSERYIGKVLDLMNEVEARDFVPAELVTMLITCMAELTDYCENTKLYVSGALGDGLILEDRSRFEFLHGDWVHVIPSSSRRKSGIWISSQNVNWLGP